MRTLLPRSSTAAAGLSSAVMPPHARDSGWYTAAAQRGPGAWRMPPRCAPTDLLATVLVSPDGVSYRARIGRLRPSSPGEESHGRTSLRASALSYALFAAGRRQPHSRA